MERGAAGDSRKDSLFAGKSARDIPRLVRTDGHDLVNDFRIQDFGNEIGADALNPMGPGLAAGKDEAL